MRTPRDQLDVTALLSTGGHPARGHAVAANGSSRVRVADIDVRYSDNDVRSPDDEVPHPADGDEPQSNARRSMVSQLVDLATSRCELWHTPDGEAHVSVMLDDHREHHRVGSKGFRQFLARTAYRDLGCAAGETMIRDACAAIAGIANYDAPEHAAHVRVAGEGGTVWLDLCDATWRAVAVDEHAWRVVERPPVRFTRRGAMEPLPVPVGGGSLDELREHVRVADESWPLVAGWLVGALMPRGPYPALLFRGQHGAGKSWSARILRSLVDPSKAPIRSEPREPRDLIVAARGSWVVALDNISSIPRWLSDGLCRLATGGGYSARALYTDDDEIVVDVQRPTILTGITDVVTAPDLLDRSLLVELEPISEEERRAERDLTAAWAGARPRVFGAVLDCVSCSLRERDSTHLPRLPRLADWATVATAAETAMGLPRGAVLEALDATREDATEIALEASAIASPLRALVRRDREWTGTAGGLLHALALLAEPHVTHGATWPKSERGLVASLTRLAPSLAATGILVKRLPRGTAGHRGQRPWRVTSSPSPSPSPEKRNGFGRDDDGDVGDGWNHLFPREPS